MRRLRRSESGFSLVELLVAMGVTAILATATVSVLVTTSRANQFQDDLRTVMDDGRISLDRIRKELRGGRRVLAGSDAHELYWWVDTDQDGVQQSSELVHYCVADVGSTICKDTVETGSFQLVRWTDAELQTDARTIATTLTSTDVFSGYAATVTDTRVVTIELELQVDSASQLDTVQLSTEVRLRNVA